MAKLVNANQDALTVEVSKANTKCRICDCGLFACAYNANLVHGQDPCTIIYDQRKMRPPHNMPGA